MSMKILKTMNGPSGGKVTRGEKILQRFVDEAKISECGKDWMLCALDPFHDHQLKNLKGWPDVQTGASVVRLIKQSVSVSAPAGFIGNWDCHIVQWPWLTPSTSGTAVGNFTSLNRLGQNLTLPAALGANSRLGGLQMFLVPAGTPLNILTIGGTQLLATLAVDPNFTKGVARLIGMGFEVHNTTSQLNIQGSVIGYRQMANENTNLSWSIENATTYCGFDGPLVKYPPSNSADALLLAGSRQWEAKDGIYSVSSFHTTENPATLIVPTAPVIAGDDILDLEGSLAVSNLNVPVPGPVDANGYAAITSFRVFNIHQNGAIFSGLSPQTTLTINWNVFLETFPSTDDVEILPLATPSAEFDPEILDLYSRVSTDLPVAVPVNENGLGDWFYDAAVTAAKYIGPVLSALPHPVLKGIGTAATGIANYVDKNPTSTPAGNGANKNPPNSWAAQRKMQPDYERLSAKPGKKKNKKQKKSQLQQGGARQRVKPNKRGP
jgi:hypothetical protein